jgi:hypothetical protein
MICIRRWSAVAVFLVCFNGLVLAQGGATGAITGTVQDASGAVLAGAKVSAEYAPIHDRFFGSI